MNDYLERSKQLLGEDKIAMFADKTIVVIGIGGVGGTALEALARSGFKKFILIDFDEVSASNINRQILFTSLDVGKTKVDCAKEHLLKVCRDLQIDTFKLKIGDCSLNEVLKIKPDFIVDAIDYVPGKLHIFEYALENNISFISSLGMGNRLNPEMVTITNLSKTENDPLAKKMRYEAKKLGLDIKKIPVVFSKEEPLLKSKQPASMIMVPSEAGLLIAKYVISTII